MRVLIAFTLLLATGCDEEPESEVDLRVGACVLLNGGTADHPQPFEYCQLYEGEFCQGLLDDFATGEFIPQVTCPSVGFPICCETSIGSQWHEDQEQADAARQSIAGEDCQPC